MSVVLLAIGSVVLTVFFTAGVAAMIAALGWRVTALIWALTALVTSSAVAFSVGLAEVLS